MLSRRSFVNLAAGGLASRAQAQGRYATAQTVTEWSYTSSKRYKDPFSEVELDVIFEGPAGEHRVPAFWSGEQEWVQVSYPVMAGSHTFEWHYVKNSSDSSGQDTVWLDDITFPLQ